MYKAELVDAARHEIEVRSKAEGLKEKTAEFDDAKLQEILSSSGIYSDELVYACSIEKSRRDTEREIRMKEEQVKPKEYYGYRLDKKSKQVLWDGGRCCT